MVAIGLLKNHPAFIPQLVSIWRERHGNIWSPHTPIEKIIEGFHGHLNDGQLPLTHVAFHGEQPIGMCSLRENDGIRPDLKPWLGTLVVDAAYQGQGIGEMLIDATKIKARDLGFKDLYLLAFDPTIPQYYGRLGWNVIGQDELKGHAVTVMKVAL